MNKDEKRELRRKRLMENKAYQTMNSLTRYMDRYYLDALIGIIPGWGDAIALLSVEHSPDAGCPEQCPPRRADGYDSVLRWRRYRFLPSCKHPEHADDSGFR